MQRHSWEQGVAAQAFLELGDTETVILMAKEAVLRQLDDGRLGVMSGSTAATDPAANGEPVLYASRLTKDKALAEAADKMLQWLLYKAPRTKNGGICHFDDKAEVWVDSYYMSPPLLAVAGYYKEAVAQINSYRELLYNADKKLFSHMWDDASNSFVRKDFWGVGNGWALAGMTRVLRVLPDNMKSEKKMLINYIKEGVDGCLACMREDGLFHDVIDDPSTFVETNLSQMLAYTIFRGIAGGWLDSSYLIHGDKMREAANDKVDEYGFVQGVCGTPNFNSAGTAAEGQAFFVLMEAAANDYYSSL